MQGTLQPTITHQDTHNESCRKGNQGPDGSHDLPAHKGNHVYLQALLEQSHENQNKVGGPLENCVLAREAGRLTSEN